MPRDGVLRISGGSEFQRFGATGLKALSPNGLRLVWGIERRPMSVGCRVEPIRSGDLEHLQVRRRILYEILDLSGSQWRCMRVGVMCCQA